MLRAKLGWAATEKLDLQFVADYSKDDYGGRTFGLQEWEGEPLRRWMARTA